MRLEKASYKAIKYACLKFHYAKSVPVNVFGYSVFNKKNEWCGIILYGTGANNNIAKTYNLNQGEVIELVRVALNGKQDITSKCLGISLRLIKKDLPLCRKIVSYADIDQGHKGTIYKATNWVFEKRVLENKKDGSFIINNRRTHSKTISDKLKKYKLPRNIENIKKVYNTNDVESYTTKGKIKYTYNLK
jgi:hypothetical protein